MRVHKITNASSKPIELWLTRSTSRAFVDLSFRSSFNCAKSFAKVCSLFNFSNWSWILLTGLGGVGSTPSCPSAMKTCMIRHMYFENHETCDVYLKLCKAITPYLPLISGVCNSGDGDGNAASMNSAAGRGMALEWKSEGSMAQKSIILIFRHMQACFFNQRTPWEDEDASWFKGDSMSPRKSTGVGFKEGSTGTSLADFVFSKTAFDSIFGTSGFSTGSASFSAGSSCSRRAGSSPPSKPRPCLKIELNKWLWWFSFDHVEWTKISIYIKQVTWILLFRLISLFAAVTLPCPLCCICPCIHMLFIFKLLWPPTILCHVNPRVCHQVPDCCFSG